MSRVWDAAESLTPPGLRARLRRLPGVVPAVRWLRDRTAPRMSVGLGVGLRFRAGPSNPSYASGANEMPVQEALARQLRRGDVFYDVGANVGFFSVIGARLVGKTGQVLAFEPVPENAELVRQNARTNGFANVQVIEKAVFRHGGHAKLAVAQYSGGSMLASVGAPPDDSGRTLEVETICLDDWIIRDGGPAPALVKIDVEGAEEDVLVGMTRTLTELRPVVIYEVDDADSAALERKDAACRARLEAAGYRVRALPDAYADSGWQVRNSIAVPGERS